MTAMEIKHDEVCYYCMQAEKPILTSLLCTVLNSKLIRLSFPPHTSLCLFSLPSPRQYLPASLPPAPISHFTTYHITEASANHSRARALFRLLALPPSSHQSRSARMAWLGLAAFAHLLKVKKEETAWTSTVKAHPIPYLRQIANLGIQRQKFLGKISDFPDTV